MSIPREAIDLMLESEGIDQPYSWPGGDSGITIGYGYDLGYESHFERDWKEHLSISEIGLLKGALGLKGYEARRHAPRFAGILIKKGPALDVFINRTLPHYEEETRHAFPGVEKLPTLAFGALVSLVFNRGSGMTGPRRAEMREIRGAIRKYARFELDPVANCLRFVAGQIRAMKHLWRGKGLDGLLVRREAEADLMESAIGEI